MDQVATSSGPQSDQRAEIGEVLSKLERIENVLVHLVAERTVKDWYSTREIAEILDKAEFTVREWCRLGRVNAVKRATGRGNTREWMISHDELIRSRNHGLLPVAKYRFHG